MRKTRLFLGAVATTAVALAGLGVASPAHADTQMNLTGPNTAAAGAFATFTVTGTFQQGTVRLLDQNGAQCGNDQSILLPPPPSLTFQCQIPNYGTNVTYTAVNYDDSWSSIGFSNAFQVNIGNKASTQTQIAGPNIVKVNTATKITVNVNTTNGSRTSPTGSVVVTDQNGNTVTTMGLTPNGGGSAYAYWTWTPTTVGTTIFTAAYQGDANSSPSTSQQDAINVTASGNTISLTAPGTMTVGVPVTLTATLVPSSIQGSVGFTYNGAPISASVPIKNGVATFNWTPTTAGQATLGANYTTNGGQTGSTTDKVNIVAGAAATDVITLTQPGYGTWANGATYPLGNGTNFTFQARTNSGSAVNLSATGPCAVNGLNLKVTNGQGQCTLTATSNGGNGYAAATNTYTVNANPGQQSATVAAPQSGPITKGRTYLIDGAGQVDTNAGQNINWKITKGKPVCKLIFPSDGSVKLKAVKKGQCSLVGTAPGVPGQWAPYKLVRSYRA